LAKRILIFTNHFYPEQFKINEIVTWLAKEGYEIRVITGYPNYPQGKFYHKSTFESKTFKNISINRLLLIPRGNGNILMLFLNYLSYFFSAFIFTIYIAIFKKKYDNIFVHHTSPFLVAIHPIIYSLFHKPVKKIIWDLDLWPESLEAVGVIKAKKTLFIIEGCVKFIYSFYDKVLVGSQSFKKIIKKRFNKEIIYFPNWAEEEIEENIIFSDIKISYPKNKFIITYTGNIGQAQGFERLTQTINYLKNENILWVFIGGGRYKKKFRELIDKKNLSHLCIFQNQVPVKQIPSFINKSDAVFISLAKKEIFSKTVPAKLQTYLALGKPIIGVLDGEAADIVNKSKSGIIQENHNYEELAYKISDFIKLSEEDLNKMGINAKKFYLKNYTRKLRKAQILNLFS
jgi:glycosyltransferase involved in cell wall biosynthesis